MRNSRFSFKWILHWIAIYSLLAAVTAVAAESNLVSVKSVTWEISPSLDSAVEENVLLYLNALSPPFLTPLNQYRRLAISEINKAVKALGYYHAQVDIVFSPPSAEQQAKVQIVLNEPVRIRDYQFSLEGEGEHDPVLLAYKNKEHFDVGDIFHHGRYEAIKSGYNRLAMQRGYFDARWKQHEVIIDPDTSSATISLILDLGRRYRFGSVSIMPAESSEAGVVLATAPFIFGQPYRAQLIADYNVDLSATGYFKSVIVRPLIEKADNGLVPVEVQVIPKADNIFEVGGGYSTDVKFRGRLYWTHPWLNRWGHSFTAGVEGSTDFQTSEGEQTYTFSYKIPIEDPINNYFNLVMGINRKRQNDTDERVIGVQAQRLQKLDSRWQRTFFLRWQRDDYRQSSQSEITDLIIPGISYGYTRSMGGIDPYEGYQQMVTLELSEESWGSDTRFVKIRSKTKWLNQFWEWHRFFFRCELGAIAVEDILDIPSSMRFFTGGDQSIRGFGYETIAPKDSDGGLIGGKFLTVGSLEYSYPFIDRWRWALFTDLGTVTNDFSEPVSIGSGFGIHWSSPVGPIRLDFAFAMSEPGYPFRLHFTMGPQL